MEFSELVTAIQEKDSEKTNRLLEVITPRLIRFLVIHMNATEEDAQDCVQDSLLASIRAMEEGRIRQPNLVFSYLLTTCRNHYLKMRNRNREENYDRVPESHFQSPGQLHNLIGRERDDILRSCMDELKDDYREFIEYWFEHPESSAKEVADHFGISVNNAWTKKHRIIRKLQKCYRHKSNL